MEYFITLRTFPLRVTSQESYARFECDTVYKFSSLASAPINCRNTNSEKVAYLESRGYVKRITDLHTLLKARLVGYHVF